MENLPSDRPPNPTILRDPLIAIPDPTQTLKPEVGKEGGLKARAETTPTKPKARAPDAFPPFRTPEKPRIGALGKNKFGWSANEPRNEMASYLGQSSRNGGSLNMTPRVTKPAASLARPSTSLSDTTSSFQTTPTKSVSKPPTAGFAPMSSSRCPGTGSYSRAGNFSALSRGIPVCNGLPMVVNTAEVPHFDLKEDPSFWIHHNVQVIIRVRPLNSAERSAQGYNRCVKQESSQNITWIGQPETRFTFDHVACETVDQEMLFRKAGLPMVENCLSGYNSCMFAYGQTGSGKTYTMLGDIDDFEFKPSSHRGMTPRIFEYLFARIRAEEESRREDQLKYSCKCSFLEIYNEQITDLLNPSSVNLLLREDSRQGIYVENLSEFEVYSVGDILNLLAEGSLNRKVAATHMNKESSRSHSVFTCVIESKWERDSTSNLRFARLNLVDLAGSERQKTSGAEGERLKEAASINKSLSTLGHVIMVLVDVANGKMRHVPYRDSKLTFLLQDSLGGNSKTIIIANISPSSSCAAETLNTLKFAQRGKLIQNNAIVNEDSSGDVSALQHQIRLLKEELSALKRQQVSRSLSFGPRSLQYSTDDHEDVDMEIDQPISEDSVQFEAEVVKLSPQQLKSLEKMVAGALRREQMAETSIKKLEDEIEHLSRLVHQREEDTRCSKMKLKFREDKIRRMESLLKGVQPMDSYLVEENAALLEEIQMLQENVNRNPEVTRFALENIRLLEQVRRFQDFYEEGEREILLSEVSELRDKLIQLVDEKKKQDYVHSNIPIAPKEPLIQDKKEKCVDLLKPAEELLSLELELDILKIILKEERSSRAKADELVTSLSTELKLVEEGMLSIQKQYEDVNEQLKEAKSTIEVLKSQQLLSVDELEGLKSQSRQYVELLRKQELELVDLKQQTSHQQSNGGSIFPGGKCDDTPFQFKFEKIQASLEKAKVLNASFQRDHAFLKANEEEMDEIRQQVEEETAQVILCLQEELSALQQQVQDSSWKEKDVETRMTLLETTLSEKQEAFDALASENEVLREEITEKEKAIELISKDWVLLSSEIEGSLTDGHEALVDASDQLDDICGYVPTKGRWISEQVHRLIKQASEKELAIGELNACLENANARVNDMDCMLRSLKGAARVITESHQKECSEKEKEIHRLRCELNAKSMANMDVESKISLANDEVRKSSKCATVAFVIVNRLSEINYGHLDSLKHAELQIRQSKELNQIKDGLLDECAVASEEAMRQIEALRKELELSEESCNRLRDELAKKQVCISVMERNLEEYHELDILKTKEKLYELQEGVSIMKSCMNNYAEQAKKSTQISEFIDGSKDDWSDNAEDREEYHGHNNSVGCPTDDESGSTFKACSNSNIHEDGKENVMSTKICKGSIRKDGTITLLRKEIESAMESLKDVQAEVVRLHADNQKLSISERQSREGMEMAKAQICHIQAAFGDFEDQCLHKMKALNQKLEKAEQHAEEATCSWCLAKETFENDLSNATVDIAKKTAEASCLFSKFEEAQDIMKEADVMIKGLMISNETMKLELEDLKCKNLNLSCERDSLVQDIQSLQSYNVANNQQCYELIQELEIIISQAQDTSEEAVLSISNDISSVKSQVRDSGTFIQSWIEDICSEIIVKDSAVSVLHLCHMGILLEAVTGLNAENSLLNNGLSESNAMVSCLREQNMKSLQELEAFSIFKGNLLADIKRSFDRIISKEDEIDELSAKFRFFESTISDLQIQEGLLLERSNYLGIELANIVKDLNETNSDQLASLLEQEKFLNDSKEAMASQEENLMIELSAKDLELVIMTLELQHLADGKAEMETKQIACCTVLEHLKREFITVSITSNMMEQLLLERDAEVIHLHKEVGKANLNLTQSYADVIYLDVINTTLKEELLLQKETAFLNENLKRELHETLESKEKMSERLQELEIEHRNLTAKSVTLDEELLSSSGRLLVLGQRNQDLQNELKVKDEQLSNANFLEQANLLLKEELDKLKIQSSLLITDVQEKDSEVKSCLESIHNLESKISFLQDDLDLRKADLEKLQYSHSSTKEELCQKSQELHNCFMKLNALEENNVSLKDELRCLHLSKFEALSLSSSSAAKCFKRTEVAEMESQTLCAMLNERIELISDRLSQDTCENMEVVAKIEVALEPLEAIVEDIVSENITLHAELLKEEENNVSLKDELRCLHLSKFEALSLSSSSAAKCFKRTEVAEMKSQTMCAMLNERIELISDRLSQDTCENMEVVAKIEAALEPLEAIIENIVSENITLHAELLKKEEVLSGLLFDLSLLQESASSTRDQKEDIEVLTASLNSKVEELTIRSRELDDVVAHVDVLEAQMKEKIDQILLLERDLSLATNAVEMLSKEKADLTSHVEEMLAAKITLERELTEKKKLVESLEIEIVDMENSVGETNTSVESLKSELEEVKSDRDQLQKELLVLEEKLDTAQALADEYEAIAMEAKQISESSRIYGEEKEEEVKLLEKSVQELDRTVDVLENKVDILKEETERQRLQREELEMELDSLKHQMHNLKSADSDIKRHLEEREQNLQKALKNIQKLEKDLVSKDTEISHCKAHITELNLHAEAHASEYKKKFKALEAMAGQVKSECPSSHCKSSSSNKLDKNATKPRGSGSPFKCMGLGLVQQLKLEKDEDLTAERLRIQELEALAANRQKEIFVLNNRLASAESMTHDVIRDLLGVKLDMTNYMSLLDKQQVQKIAENAQLDKMDSEVKGEETNKLKKLLRDFVEERKGWLEEIEKRQAELHATQLALEKLHQRERSITAENEVLKVNAEEYKKKVVELQGEYNKLYGQQNLHQRIRHHEKIKEENAILKSQNEELSARLQRAETILMRVKEHYADFDEESCLSNRLKETEEGRVKLAQELLGLCTSILKAAGVKKPSSDINVESAEEALKQLMRKMTSLERELENLKLKSRIENERIRLSEMIMQSPPLRPTTEDNCTTPRRASHSPFFSALDR